MKEKIYHQQGEKTLIYQEKREEPSRQRAKTDDLNPDGQKIVSCPSRAGAKTKQGSEKLNALNNRCPVTAQRKNDGPENC